MRYVAATARHFVDGGGRVVLTNRKDAIMLCLSRKHGETIILTVSPDDLRQLAEANGLTIKLHVGRIHRDHVRIAIDSDLRVKVLRSELQFKGKK